MHNMKLEIKGNEGKFMHQKLKTNELSKLKLQLQREYSKLQLEM